VTGVRVGEKEGSKKKQEILLSLQGMGGDRTVKALGERLTNYGASVWGAGRDLFIWGGRVRRFN